MKSRITKMVLIGLSVILVAGCGNKQLKNSYEKMEIGAEGINGYSLDLRIYGEYNNKRINEIVRVENHNNTNYKITKPLLNLGQDQELREEVIYIKNDKTYVMKDDKYVLETKDVTYNEPRLYLEGLKNIVKTEKESTEKIGENEYQVYDVIFKKSIMSKILNDTVVRDMKINKNVTGKVYLNKDKYVYRIIYNLGDITINANYFGINSAREIIFPEEIK